MGSNTNTSKYCQSGKLLDFLIMVIAVATTICLVGCKKLVESDPPSDYVTGSSAFNSNASAIGVLNKIYADINNSGGLFQGNKSISLLTGLGADELTLYSGITDAEYLGYYRNSLAQQTGVTLSGEECWAPLYAFVFRCNAAIEGLEASPGLLPVVKQQLLGESKFLRALFYFYLVNLYGDVPLALTTDPEINSLLSRSSQQAVWQQIIADLLQAKDALSPNYLDGTLLSNSSERVRPNTWAAAALLSRVYLYTGEWAKAEEQASAVINTSSMYGLPIKLDSVFLKNSKEAIWQVQPTAINYNTQEARTLIIPQAGPNTSNNPVFLSDTLLNSFEPGDLRAKLGNWVDTTIYKINSTLSDTVAYSNKYKINLSNSAITTTSGTQNMTEYFMVLRLAEQYLIRAEARAKQGSNMSGAQSDLNTIRARAGLSSITAANTGQLITAILHERQVELFMELGQRWLDLKRTGKIDVVMNGITPLKANGASWQSYQQWYPLPLTDMQKSPNLIQNTGY